MKTSLPLRLLPLPLALGFVVTGCLSRPALTRQNYVLQTPPVSHAAANTSGVLAISHCQVTPMFSGQSLVYRTGPDSYEIDPYAGFLIPPDRAVAIPVRGYLRNSGPFKDVVEPGSDLKPDTLLEIYVTDLYGDFRKTAQPAAVLTVRLILFDSADANAGKPLFQKEYSRRVPLTQNTAASVVTGWNQALAGIMVDAANDMTNARLQASKSN